MAAGIYADVPDLSLTCDEVRCSGSDVIYVWFFIVDDYAPLMSVARTRRAIPSYGFAGTLQNARELCLVSGLTSDVFERDPVSKASAKPNDRSGVGAVVLAMQRSLVAERGVLAYLMGLAALSYGFFAFNLTLNGDDWIFLFEPRARQDFFFSIGRISHDTLAKSLITPRFAPTISAAFLWTILVSCGLWIGKSFRIKNRMALFLVASLFALCPVWAEQMSFKDNHAAVGLAILLATTGYLMVMTRHDNETRENYFQHMTALSVILGISFTFHQMSALLFLTLCVAGGLVGFICHEVTTSRVVLTSVNCLVATGGAVFVYILILLLATQLTAPGFVPESYDIERGRVSSLVDLSDTARRMRAHLVTFLFQDQHLWALPLKWIGLTFLCAILLKTARSLSLPRFGVILILFILLIMVPWLFGLIWTPDNAYRYNALLAVPVVYSTLAAVVFLLWPSGILHGVAMGLGAFLTFHFAAAQNVAGLAALTTNQRDLAVLERMVARVETHPSYADIDITRPLRIVIAYERFPDPRLSKPSIPFEATGTGDTMRHSIVQCGIFLCQPGRASLALALIDHSYHDAGRSISVVLSFEDLPRLGVALGTVARVRNATTWPLPGSVIFEGNTALIRYN